jgi:hypothetical protein
MFPHFARKTSDKIPQTQSLKRGSFRRYVWRAACFAHLITLPLIRPTETTQVLTHTHTHTHRQWLHMLKAAGFWGTRVDCWIVTDVSEQSVASIANKLDHGRFRRDVVTINQTTRRHTPEHRCWEPQSSYYNVLSKTATLTYNAVTKCGLLLWGKNMKAYWTHFWKRSA